VRRSIRIGTRGSQLALAQSRWVQVWLQRQHPQLEVELVTITTSGDRFVEQPLSALGGKGLFVKEIEEALRAGSIDCAVHSMKDVPGELAPGLVIAAVPAREDPRDVLVTPDGLQLEALPRGARLGTSSLRRMALVRAARGDLEVTNLRGNIDTRLRKLARGDCDAIVLACAGLRRLGIRPSGMAFFDPQQFIPAIGQGALAIESRTDETTELLAPLDDVATRRAVTAERAFLARAGGSCHTPLAAHATVHQDTLDMRALIASPDGRQLVRGERRGPVVAASALGIELAEELLRGGGAGILRALGIGYTGAHE
jgi:hydroxymethylbilane synthase